MVKGTTLFMFLLLAHTWAYAYQDTFSLQVGAAETEINPPAGAFIAGHTLNRRFIGIHDSLYAKAVVISDSRTRMAILSVDCIGMLYPQLEEIRIRVAERMHDPSFSADRIVLASTHTHAGPDVVGLWGPVQLKTGRDPAYMHELINKCVEQIVRANEQLVPVKARYAVTTFGSEWVYNISEPAELDRSLTVLQFVNEQGGTVATLTNFACHPTIVDGVHNQVSADYPAGFYRKMKQEVGGVHLFLQGPIGGWVQPEFEAKTFEQAVFRGEQMADTVLAALRTFSMLQSGKVAFFSKRFNMPVNNPGFRLLAAAGVIDRPMDSTVRTEIAWFSIGEAMFATHPGETVPAMGTATKALMHTQGPKMVIGLGMDAMGYILHPYFFDPARTIPHASYLCSMSVGPDAMPLIMRVLQELAYSKQ